MLAFTMQLICLGLVSPLVGRAVDHYGEKVVISLGALVAALGFLLLPLTTSLSHFYMGNIIVGLGSAAMGPVPLSAAVTKSVDTKRGMAVGTMSTGIGVGGFVAAPFIGGVLLPSSGWKISYVWIAAITLTMIPLSWLFLRFKLSPPHWQSTKDVLTNPGERQCLRPFFFMVQPPHGNPLKMSRLCVVPELS